MTRLEPQSEGVPLPQPSSWSRPFWDACARGQLIFQRCQDCHSPVFNPALLCRFCGSRSLEWERSAGRGELYSWSVVWRPQTQAFRVPYAPAIVDLDEGYQMVSSVIGCGPDDLRLGMRLSVCFHPIGGGVSIPYFRPSGDGGDR